MSAKQKFTILNIHSVVSCKLALVGDCNDCLFRTQHYVVEGGINMTTNQFNYAQLSETRRANRMREIENTTHNRNVEQETFRHDVMTEAADFGRLEESKRHNLVSESTENYKALETARHNAATEEYSWANLGETQRHNIVTENISAYEADTRRYSASEQHRHNVAQEGIDTEKLRETVRHDYASEYANLASAHASQTAADAHMKTADTGWAEHLNNVDKRELEENKLGLSLKQYDLEKEKFDTYKEHYEREWKQKARDKMVSTVQHYLPSISGEDIAKVIKQGSGLIWTAGF